MLKRIEKALDMGGIHSMHLQGSSSQIKKIIENFNSDTGCNVLLLSVELYCSGLDLSCANYVYLIDSLLDSEFKPEEIKRMEDQASGRVIRLGQRKSDVYIKRLVLDAEESPDIQRYHEYINYFNSH